MLCYASHVLTVFNNKGVNNMEIKSNLCSNAMRKIALLITKASDLGMDISGYGYADENSNSGYIYLWLEDYAFTLFIRPCGGDEVEALWTNPENGDEYEVNVADKTLSVLEQWADNLYLSECSE